MKKYKQHYNAVDFETRVSKSVACVAVKQNRGLMM